MFPSIGVELVRQNRETETSEWSLSILVSRFHKTPSGMCKYMKNFDRYFSTNICASAPQLAAIVAHGGCTPWLVTISSTRTDSSSLTYKHRMKQALLFPTEVLFRFLPFPLCLLRLPPLFRLRQVF